jgi:hypothetical protein
MSHHLGAKHGLSLLVSVVGVAICLGAATAAGAEHMNSTPQQVKRSARSLPMGFERTVRWRMVDRGK